MAADVTRTKVDLFFQAGLLNYSYERIHGQTQLVLIILIGKSLINFLYGSAMLNQYQLDIMRPIPLPPPRMRIESGKVGKSIYLKELLDSIEVVSIVRAATLVANSFALPFDGDSD